MHKDGEKIVPLTSQTTRARRGRGAGHGGPANGPGWGGPAKGAGHRITAADAREIATPCTPARLADKLAAVEAVYAMWHEIAMDRDAPHMARIAAGGKLVEHVEGRAIQRIAATPAGETVEELRAVDPRLMSGAERATLRAVISRAREG